MSEDASEESKFLVDEGTYLLFFEAFFNFYDYNRTLPPPFDDWTLVLP